MEVKDFLSINGGVGENSYAHNSRFARKVLARTKPYFVEAIEDLVQDQVPLKLLRAADLGCSCGQNVISIMAAIMDTVAEMHRKVNKGPPEIQFLLNDLPSNDFNSLFRGLPSFLQRVADNKGGLLSCYVMGVPGSFHGRLFPNNDLHFVYSLYSVHWLSQGLVEQKRLDDWNVPVYAASMEEVKSIVEREGSFLIRKFEAFELPSGEETDVDKWVNAQKQAKNVRSFTETLIAQQFGEKIIEHLYDRLAQLIVEALDNEGTHGTSLTVVLKKK